MAVRVEGLRVRYGDTLAVDDLSLSVERASITAVLGPNGAGKTTTVEACEGYRRPDAGTVRVLGLDPIRDRHQLRPRIGVMLQRGGAWGGVRAMEMLQHMAALHAHPLDVQALGDRLGLEDCGRTPYRRLSGGQQQRLALAMAVVGRPELVFVDEPTAGLDPHARRAAWDLLAELREHGVTVVLTTHYLEEAERLADLVHILDRGRLIASGTPADLVRQQGSTSIRVVTGSGVAPGALEALRRRLDAGLVVTATGADAVVVTGPVDDATMATVAQWCQECQIRPESLTMGQRSLEDVFLHLTERGPAS